MTNTFASVTYSITGKRLDGTSLSLTKTQSLAVAQEGQNGGKGDQGDRGPGVTFRGLFSTGEFYVNDGDIRDVVEHPADSQAYYAVAVGTGSSGSSGTSLGTPSTINSN